MDHGLHAQRGHGHLCVYSAPRVGTVCVRCAAEAISATHGAEGGGGDGATQQNFFSDSQPGSSPAHAQRTLTPQRQRLNTTRARHARSLAGILRDPAAGPDVARQWGHVVVACVVDALAVWEDEDAEVASLLLDAALAVSTAASASDAGATLDACVSRAVMHLSSRDTARGRGGGPPAAFNQPRHHLPPPNSLHNSGASSQPSQEHFYIAPPRGSQGYNSQPGGAVGSSWDSTWERGGAMVPTTAAPPPAATGGGGGPGWDSSSFGVAPLTSTQPRAARRPRAHEDAGRARLLRLIAELLALDVPHGSLPTVFLPNPVEQRGWTGGGAVGFSQPADSQSQGWYGGTPPGQHPSSSYRGQAIATSTSTSALALVIDALGDGCASKETRLAALSVCSQLANRAAAFPSLLASDPGAGDAMAAGALGSVLVCARSSGAATDADAGAVAEALLVVASVANADREFDPEKLLTACPPGVSIAKVPTFVQVVNESLLSPRLALRADACDCLAVVVAASSSSVASVESILRHEVAEHVFELLRDISRARAAEEGIDRDGRARPRHTRGFPAGVPPRADRDVAARTALAALAALAGCAPRVFNPRLVHGADPVAAVLTKAVSDRDWEVTLAGAELLRSVAAGEDPGNVPEESLGALVACLADACEHGRGTEDVGWREAGRVAGDALGTLLRQWGVGVVNADVASRVFRAFVADVERNLESFVRGGTTELDGSLTPPGGSVFGGVRWDLSPSTSSGARAVGCRLASTGHLARCLAIVRGGHLPALVFEATARLSSVRRGGRMLVGNDADVADGVAVACASMIRLLRGLLAGPDHGGIAGHHEDGGDDTSAESIRREFAVELIRDHRAIESCLDGVDAGVFDYEPPGRDQFPERLQSGPGCDVFYDVLDSDDEEDANGDGETTHAADHPTPALLCNLLAQLLPAALGDGAVPKRGIRALANTRTPALGPRAGWGPTPGGNLFDVMAVDSARMGASGACVRGAQDAVLGCAFARAKFSPDAGTDRDEFSRVLAEPMCEYLSAAAGAGGGCAEAACMSLVVWHACVRSLEVFQAGTETFNPGARRVANNVARVERDLTGGLLGSLENIHKLNAVRWCAAETALVNYVIDSVSGSGRLLLAWLADSFSCHANGIEMYRSVFFGVLNREDVRRAVSSDDEISADAPVGSRKFAQWFSENEPTVTFLARCFVSMESASESCTVTQALRFVLGRRPPTAGALAIHGTIWDACSRLRTGVLGSAQSIERDIAADVALLHADARNVIGVRVPNFVFDAGSLAGYLYDLVTVAAESTAAASVVNAVLLNVLVSKVHEGTGATESTVGIPRLVVASLIPSVIPAILIYAREVVVNWRGRTFSSLTGAISAVTLFFAAYATSGDVVPWKAAGTKAGIDETSFTRALGDVSVGCEDPICRRLAFEALAATAAYFSKGRGEEATPGGFIVACGRAGLCAGSSEGERDAAAACAVPFDDGEESRVNNAAACVSIDECYWEETLLEEWLLSERRGPGTRGDESRSSITTGRLAFAWRVMRRSGRILARVLRDETMRETLVSLALTAAWRSGGSDPAPVKVLGALFVPSPTEREDVASSRRAVPHDVLRGCIDAMKKIPPRGDDIAWAVGHSRAGGSGTVLVENVHTLFVARVHDGGIAEVYDPSGERARLCDEMEIVARAAKLREGGGRM